ncbi:hypothetical protein PH213_20505 [Streptomyces sp. SRF1]|nr:hypothetical protein [Streptomyces sp. SRF1]MDN3056889.1 hypothetical protein [Streptomyces sp. SRF1]
MPSYIPLTALVLVGVAVADLSGSRALRSLAVLVAVWAWLCLMTGMQW